jgi:hypothetical protein
MVMANEGLVLQNLAVVKAQTAPLHRLLYLAQPEANSCFPSAGGHDKVLASKTKDEAPGIASQAQSVVADTEVKGKEAVEKTKSKLS